jgi:signal transduction histidine kinase
MEFNIGRRDLFSAVGWRLLFAGIAIFLLIRVVITTTHYMSALVLSAASCLLLFDAARFLRSTPLASAIVPPVRPSDEQRLDRMQGLLDAVSIAFFTIDADNRITLANRAARLLAGVEAARLQDFPGIGQDAADKLLTLPSGGRQLVLFADGRTMLAWVGSFTTPREHTQRLLSLQAVTGDLDAVQVGAWHMMTRVLAHEMMNSLTPIASLSESLQRIVEEAGDLPPRITGAIDTIARRSSHLIRFVERYRAVVSLPEPQPRTIDLSAFMNDIEALIAPGLHEQGTSFAMTLPPANSSFKADPDQLGQALLNLLHNAAEAVATFEDGRIEVVCAFARDSVSIEVQDNGQGAGSHQFDEMFVPFFTTKVGGSGIGLPMARQIALLHGGKLTGWPNPARGMTFRITLPAPPDFA